MTFDFRNTNSLWASVLAATLARLGLTTAVISPGSRSTPLTVALVSHPAIEVVPVLDERSAAFFALGIARRTGQPVVLVCTSGTAGANYYPAVIEARESCIPLLVMTADRPPELRNCASGQTIDQQRLFGSFPLWYAELAVPVAEEAMLRYLRQTLIQAWGQSLYPAAGPVHLNCPFRDPLAPIADGSIVHLKGVLDEHFLAAVAAPEAAIAPAAKSVLTPEFTTARLLEGWQRCDRGLIVAGPAQPLDPVAYCKAIAALSAHLGWPVLADGLSPLRNAAALNPYLVSTYDLALGQIDGEPSWAATLVPEQVIQLGPLPTSKRLREWLQLTQPRRWVIDPAGTNLDPLHGPTMAVPLAPETLAWGLSARSTSTNSAYLNQWMLVEQRLRHYLDTGLDQLETLFEGKVPWLLARCLPTATPVVLANSMPIRDVEWFWPPGDRGLRPYCNRGANGIDGTLSTALGIAHGGPPTVLLTGDLALLHDTNGWLSVPRLRGHLTVVVINNRGGGIFDRLPIATVPTLEESWFEDFFTTPQTVDLNRLCAAYGVNYERVETWSQLADSLSSLPERGVRLLEVRCDRQQSHTLRQQLLTPPKLL